MTQKTGFESFIISHADAISDALYLDNHGNQALPTTDGIAIGGPASWTLNENRMLGDAGAYGGTQKKYR